MKFGLFSHPDRPFVKKEILEFLEQEFGLRLCIHERDFLGGATITANITAAIGHSRRMIMVISRYCLCYNSFNNCNQNNIT